MSYVPKLSNDARRGLRALPVDIQEAVLDVLENLAAEAVTDRLTAMLVSEHHVVVYRDDKQVYKVFIATDVDHSTQTLVAVSIWYVARI